MRLFDSFSEWWCCARNAGIHLGVGLWQMLQAVIIGLASFSRALWRATVSAVGSYPNVALIAFLAALALTWITTFATLRYRAVQAEDQRDSIAWKFQNFRHVHGYE